MRDIHYQDNNSKNYYCMDFSNLISSTDSISGVPTVNDTVRGGGVSDLVIEDVGVSGNYVCMFISSGTPHKTYNIEVRGSTANGIQLAGDGYLRIGL